MATVLLVRHAKAVRREDWTGPDTERPLQERGERQAARLARAIARLDPVLVATSPWVRCQQTARAICLACAVEPRDEGRLGYTGTDIRGWVEEVAAAHPDKTVVGVGHGDLIPEYLLAEGLVEGYPTYRTGSLYRLEIGAGEVIATYVDRSELDAGD